MKGKQTPDKPKKLKMFLGVFYAALGMLVVIDFFVPKHPYFPWESYPSFYAVYGFIACVILVLVAKYALRSCVMRDEDYYG